MIPALHAVIKFIAVVDETVEKSFYEYPSTVKLNERLSFLFRQTEFYITFAFFALVMLILPLNWTCAALDDLFADGKSSFVNDLVVKFSFLLAIFVIDVFAHLSAYNV